MDAIARGGEWFLNNQNEDFIYYQYSIVDGTHPDTSHAMREMGALWSIYKVGDFLQDERYDALAQRGLDFFKDTIEEDAQNDFLYVNITPDKIKLGYNAFMILNLLESEDPEKETLMAGLANGILFAQEEDGGLDTFFYSDRSTGKDYYPGEALLALTELYDHTKDERYLQAVKKALPYYETYFDEDFSTAFIPWQTQAYTRYYQLTGDTEAADFVFKMSDALVEHFSDEGETCSPSLGSAGIVAAVYVEGMNKAYALALEREEDDKADCYRKFIRNGLENVLELQFPMEGQDASAFGIEAMGGFLGDSQDKLMQVDRNQHSIMALMGAYELGLVD